MSDPKSEGEEEEEGFVTVNSVKRLWEVVYTQTDCCSLKTLHNNFEEVLSLRRRMSASSGDQDGQFICEADQYFHPNLKDWNMSSFTNCQVLTVDIEHLVRFIVWLTFPFFRFISQFYSPWFSHLCQSPLSNVSLRFTRLTFTNNSSGNKTSERSDA